jgi:hypothetical protein
MNKKQKQQKDNEEELKRRGQNEKARITKKIK